jgi:hypothetical protein
MFKNFKKGFNGDNGVKLTPNKFKAFCEVDWPDLGVGGPWKGHYINMVDNEAYRVILGRAEHPDQFPYIDCWKDAGLSCPTWLRPCLEEACIILIARVATTYKSSEKTKEPILVEDIPPLYVPLYPPLPPVPRSTPLPPTLDREAWGTTTPIKSGLEAPGTSTPLTSPSPMDPMTTPSPPVLIQYSPFNQGHLTSLHEDPSFPQIPSALQKP